MVRVHLLAAQRRYTGGVADIELDAADFRALVAAICERFPQFPRRELLGYSVAIDGEIVTRPWAESLRPDSEIIFVTRIGAG
jgi:hypothetical protein